MTEQSAAPAAPQQPASGSGMFQPASNDATPPPAAPQPGQPPAEGQPPQDDRLAQGFNSLNARDHEITQRERVINSRRTDLEKLDRIKEGIANGSFDPQDMVTLFGTGDVSNLLTQFVPADKRQQPRTAEEEIRELRELFLQDRDNREQERLNQNLAGWESELTSVIQAAQDRFPYVNGLGAHDLVFKAWREEAERTGQNPDWQQFAQQVENQLIAQGERWQGILGGNPAGNRPPQSAPTAQRTLTNNMTPGAGASNPNLDEMSDADALAAAANMLVYK
jgi:hypothetical protein